MGMYMNARSHLRYPQFEEVLPFHPRCSCGISGHIEGLSDNEEETRAARVRETLVPSGKPIGEPGRRRKEVRQVKGGIREAERMFEELAALGRRVQDQRYRGELIELPGVGRIGFRRNSRSGEPTIDVYATIEGVRIEKLKFVE
jgi:hypothetical protein